MTDEKNEGEEYMTLSWGLIMLAGTLASVKGVGLLTMWIFGG